MSRKYFEEKIKVALGMIIKAMIKKKVVGFLIWLKENPKVAYIWWLVVLPKWQKRGIGEKLLEVALKEIQKRNFQKVWAKIKNDNFPALFLSLKFHFYIKGISNEDGVMTILVEKDLTKNKIKVKSKI